MSTGTSTVIDQILLLPCYDEECRKPYQPEPVSVGFRIFALRFDAQDVNPSLSARKRRVTTRQLAMFRLNG